MRISINTRPHALCMDIRSISPGLFRAGMDRHALACLGRIRTVSAHQFPDESPDALEQAFNHAVLASAISIADRTSSRRVLEKLLPLFF